MEAFKAIVVKEIDGVITYAKEDINLSALSNGEVIIKVAYSSVNYKDSLAVMKNGGVIRKYPMIPGIDLSGVIVSTSSNEFMVGQHVIVTGFDLGMTHTGGFSEYACVSAKWVVKLPENLSLKDSMIIGTAGFTAGISIESLEEMGMSSQSSPNILVTGATGGVGSLAIQLLAQNGYRNITALTRKEEYKQKIMSLGASNVISLEDITSEKTRPLMKQKYHFVLDTVGGELLTILIPQIHYGGSIAMCGNVGGINFSSTVLPFILRGINLLGIDSVNYPIEKRNLIWKRFSQEWHIFENTIVNEIKLEQLSSVFNELQKGTHVGRTIVKLTD